jgi:polysaccharide pyruvyl transferase CsaB
VKHLVISGYYGFGNAGDEAILCSMLALLRDAAREAGEELRFTVLSADPAATADSLNVQAIGRTDLHRIIRAMRRADAFLSGGGGLLQDVTGRSLSVAYYLGLLLLARLLGLPAILYAQGIGPITRPFNRLLVRLMVSRATFISVRDEGSRQELLRLGVARPPVTVTADPVFALDAADSAQVSGFLKKLAPNVPRIGISVRPWRGSGRYLAEIAAAADRLARELSAQVVLIPMYPEIDLPACRELAGLLQAPMVILDEELTPSELLTVFKGLDLVLAMRLHALVFAARAGLPMVGIGYDPKVEAMLLRLSQAKPLRPGEITAGQLAADALAQWAGREETGRRLREESSLAAQEAQRLARDVMELIIAQGKVRAAGGRKK